MKKESLPLEVEKKINIKEAPLILTSHVMERFKERWKPLDRFDLTPENQEEWRQKLELLIRNSEEVILGEVTRVRRLIENDYEDARYFYNKTHDLRFVAIVKNGSIVVKTVETPRKKKGRLL